ncbi:MAG: ribonuclease E/G [Candidatus Melainabacteria bacterium]|nr:MAG: ribonuclease E/G [Candidatus Melainabacteria bacterium]
MKDKKNFAQKEQNSAKKIVIAERDNIGALMEGDKVLDLYINRGEVLLGDVYLATVQNILPSIDAAFVDVGVDKMGFLHAQDIMGKGALKDKLSPNQKLVVQVVKEPTGHKGPRVTTEISLPGRFLVLMPSEPGINVSRKIESSKERARLKSIVSLLKPVGVGVIIRTEAEGQSEADIQEDLEILLEKWNNIVTAAESLTPPSLIYRDQDLLYRVIREACSEDVNEIIVDTAFALNRVQTLLQNWHMNKNINVTLYKGNEPLLIATNVHKEIKAALNMKVNMPSGGYLFIQQTEALTVIDVNSGKFVSSATQDETILKTNIEAVHEIARQLRLRNIGGMIIIDFIDMTSRVDKLAIMEELELAIEDDKAKPQVGQLSDLGLVEMTRHRQGQAISEVFAKKCPHCHGEGFIVEDFKFASPTAEGEYRAKAAKMKLPISGFKKNNNNKNKQNNNNNQQPQPQPQQQEMEQAQPIEMTNENPSVTAQEETKKRNDNKKPKSTKRNFNKKQLNENSEVKTAQTMITAEDEIKPVIEEPTPIQETKAEVEVQAEAPVEEKPKRTRRPNRGGAKTKRQTRSKKTSEEKVEEE